MLRTRQTLTALLGAFLLVATGGPALAGPAPFDDTTAPRGGGPNPSTSSDPGFWLYAGYAGAVVLVIAVVALLAISIDRHAHHGAARPA